jgi:hypothetical protein
MVFRTFVIALAATICVGTVSAFSSKPVSAGAQKTTLHMKNEDGRNVAATFLAAAFIAANVFTVDAAFAVDNFDFGSTEIVAGRSGGRGGGRAAPRAAPRARPSSTTRIERSTTVIQPVYSTPSVVVSPFGYNPLGGFGLGYGLGAMNDIGNEIRDYRQESEIQRSKVELEQARIREEALEARLRALEASQSAK